MLPCETAVVAVWTMVAAIDPTPSRPIWTPVLCLRMVACHPCLPAGLPPVPAVGTTPEDHLHHHEAVACPTPTILPMAGHHLHRAILLQATADPTPTDDSPQATTAATGVAVVEAIEEEEATVVPLAINAITTLPDTPVEVVAMVVTSLPLPLSLHLLLMTRYQPTKPDPIAMGRTLRTQGHPGIGVRLLFKLLYYPLSHVVLEKKKQKKNTIPFFIPDPIRS